MESLQGRDLGSLRIIAELWDLELSAPDARVGLQRLAPALLVETAVQEEILDLPEPARLALKDLIDNDGRLSWALFTRRHGIVRPMGPGRRDRERPYANSPTAKESLWYRGLIGQGFFEQDGVLGEYAYVPDDLLPLLPDLSGEGVVLLGRPASPAERAFPIQ